ncbi:hypothetical protein Dimus_023503 [Dionaea muscipula]
MRAMNWAGCVLQLISVSANSKSSISWKDLLASWPSSHTPSRAFRQMSCSSGNWLSFAFWKDPWNEVLFAIAFNRTLLRVLSVTFFVRGRLRRSFPAPIKDMADRYAHGFVSRESDGRFSVRSMYNYSNVSSGGEDHRVSVIRASVAPPKAKFLCRSARHKRVKRCSLLLHLESSISMLISVRVFRSNMKRMSIICLFNAIMRGFHGIDVRFAGLAGLFLPRPGDPLHRWFDAVSSKFKGSVVRHPECRYVVHSGKREQARI